MRTRAGSMGIKVIPWCRLAHVEHGDTIVQASQKLQLLAATANAWDTDHIIPNYEKEAETIPPSHIAAALADTGWDGNTGWSTEGWLPSDVDYSPLHADPVLLQIFPTDMKFPPYQIPQKIEDCVWHARADKGFTYVGVCYQTYGEAIPEWYDCGAFMHHVFPGNTVLPDQWQRWFP